MYKLWATIIKDTKIMLRDRVGIIMMFAMPIVLVIVVTSIQNGTFQLITKNKLPILVCNRDTGVLSKQFIDAMDKIGMFKQVQLPINEGDEKIRERMHSKDALLAIILPADFSQKVKIRAKNVTGKALNSFGLQGDTTNGKVVAEPLTLYYQPVLQDSYRLSVNGALRSALQIVESRETLRQLYFAINDKPLPEKLEGELLNNQTKINQVPVVITERMSLPNATQHNIPAWTVFAMFFIVMSLGGNIVREKRSGSFIRLKTLPTNFLVGLLSKQITYLMVTLLQAVVIFCIGIWLFPLIGLPPLNIPPGSSGLFIVTIVCGWCAVSYAICIGVFSETQEQANAFGAASVVILAAIGGLMVPSFAMPGAFKIASGFSPLHWCLEAYYGLFLEGGRLKDILNNLIPLIIITLLIQAFTFWGLRKRNLI